jgi:hypothetical protein
MLHTATWAIHMLYQFGFNSRLTNSASEKNITAQGDNNLSQYFYINAIDIILIYIPYNAININ